jgi:hypothetical protein
VTRPHIPEAVLDAAHARRAARIANDWSEADRLRREIELAGWRVVDRGADFTLVPAHPPDFAEGDRVRYGSSEGVPSRVGEPDVREASVVILALDRSADPADTVSAWLAAVAPEVQLVVVADDPDPDVLAALEAELRDGSGAPAPAPAPEVLATSAALGPGACLNVALRRAIGSTIVVVEAGTRPAGDVIARIRDELADPGVAAVGAAGLAGVDAGHLRPAPPGDVVALDGRCIGVRRTLALERGAVDERFHTWPQLAAWWTLLLRDQGDAGPPLAARYLDGLPLAATPVVDSSGDGERLARRDRYRLLDRFGGRPELFTLPRRA